MKTHNFAVDRALDLVRGRSGNNGAGVFTIAGSAILVGPTADGDFLVYDLATDTWIIANVSDFSAPITVEDEGVDTGADATVLNFVGAGVTATGAGATKTITIPGVAAGTYELANEGGQDLIKAHSTMGATETFDPTDGNVHTGTLDANCTFTLNVPTGTGAATLEIRTTQNGTGGWTITWPGSVSFVGGTPTITTTAGTTTIYVLESLDGGTTWIAVVVGGGITSASFATPAIVLGTAAATGSAATTIRSDATIVAFDATVPAAIGTAAAGSQAVAARRDHVHPTGAGTPSTQALGDAAATGTGPAAAMTDHKHAMPALSSATPLIASGSGAVGTALPSSREDHVHPAASAGDHIHIVGEAQTGNGSATVFILAQEAIPGTVAAYNVAGARANVTLGGANDQITFDTQPGTGTFYLDYIPLQA